LEEALEYYESNDPRGEYVLVIEGKSHQKKAEEKQALALEIPIEEHMKMYEDKGIDRKEAMKLVAKDRGINKREVYNYLLNL
jgi:16S rRNA (cytidine1402-2'-O)-methyltransferase